MNRRISILITANNRASAALGQAGASMSTLGSIAMRVLPAFLAWRALDGIFGMVATGLKAIGSALLSTAQTGMDFNKMMSDLGAVSNATGEQMARARELAISLGESTAISAMEVGEIMVALDKAGIGIEDSLGGATEAVTNLAIAGADAGEVAMDFTVAAEIMARAMNQFGLEAADATYASDVLASTANNTGQSVETLGSGLKYVGAAMASLTNDTWDSQQAFLEANAALGLLSDGGLTATTAGTSLNMMITKLIPNTEKGKKRFQEFGLILEDGSNRMFDASGNFIGLNEAVLTLWDSMKHLTDEEMKGALKEMFDERGARAVFTFFNAFKEGAQHGLTAEQVLEGYSEKAYKAGAASDTAGERIDNLRGDLERLGDILVGIKLTIWTQRLEESFRTVAASAETFLGNFKSAFARFDVQQNIQYLIDTILGIATKAIDVVGPRVVDFIKSIGSVETRGAIDGLTSAFNALIQVLTGVNLNDQAGQANAFAAAIKNITFADVLNGITEFIIRIAYGAQQLQGLSLLVSGVATIIGAEFTFLAEVVKGTFAVIWTTIQEAFWAVVLGITEGINTLGGKIAGALGIDWTPIETEWIASAKQSASNAADAAIDGWGNKEVTAQFDKTMQEGYDKVIAGYNLIEQDGGYAAFRASYATANKFNEGLSSMLNYASDNATRATNALYEGLVPAQTVSHYAGVTASEMFGQGFGTVSETARAKAAEVATQVDNGLAPLPGVVQAKTGEANAQMNAGMSTLQTSAEIGARGAVTDTEVAMAGMGPAVASGIQAADASTIAGWLAITSTQQRFLTALIEHVRGTLRVNMEGAFRAAMVAANAAFNTGWTTVTTTATSSLNRMTAAVRTGLSSMVGDTQRGTASMTAAWRSGMAAANSAVQSGSASMLASLRGLISNVHGLSGAANIAGRAVGAAIGQGMIVGIKSQAGAVMAAAANLAAAAAAAARSSLQIQSPSKVFEDIGHQTVAGWIRGVENMKSAVVAEYSGVATGTVRAASVAAAPSSSHLSDSPREIHIHVHGLALPEAIEAVAQRVSSVSGSKDEHSRFYGISGVGY